MLKEKLLEDMKVAMRDKQTVRKNVIQMVRAAILQVEKDKQIQIEDEQIIQIIAKESKKRKDSLSDYEKSGRQDLISQINEEIEILAEYLPKPLTREEIEKIIEEIIEQTQATTMKDMGKVIRTFRGDKLLRKLKYVIFLVFVIILPMFVVDIMGQGAPYFCKLICPAGTLEGGIPLVLLNKSMRSAVGWLYMWKNTILVITIILSIMIYRPFCKYICPLGAFYSVFNKVSVFRYRVDKEKCVHCGKCRNICQMEVDPTEDPNSTECIRCGFSGKS